MKTLVIIRGVSGTGKSTLASLLARIMTPFGHVEADQYFWKDINGEYEYVFEPKKLPAAHAWCQRTVEEHMKKGHNAIVSNTFTRKWEIEPYIELAKKYGHQVQIVTCDAKFDNVHGVPDSAVQKMRDRFELLTLKDFDL